MNIIYDNENFSDTEMIEIMKKAAKICLSEEGIDDTNFEVSFSLVSPEEIHQLNRDYRNTDMVTDVLSFPQYDDLNDIHNIYNMDNMEEICLGDVVINNQAVKSQAEEYGHSYRREFIYLFVHSILHLLGYDHMEANDKFIMRQREEEVMTKLGINRDL